MITPQYLLKQNSTHVEIKLTVPMSFKHDFEAQVEGKHFLFSSPPYFLRLSFPHDLSEKNSRVEEITPGEIKAVYEKAQHNVDYLSKLPVQNELDSSEDTDVMITEAMKNITLCEKPISNDTDYGFASLGKKDLATIFPEFTNTFDLDPFSTPSNQRNEKRIEFENNIFNADHYVADLMDRELIDEVILTEFPIKTPHEFTEGEKEFLNTLIKNKSFKLSEEKVKECLCGLVNILYAYCYDYRTTNFDSTVESPWTIFKVSATLAAFAKFTSVKEALISAYRRSVIYPLYRDFKLCKQIHKDVTKLMSLGLNNVIKSLIDIYHLYEENSEKYIINDLYIEDYLVFLQTLNEDHLVLFNSVVEEVCSTQIELNDLNLGLFEIESNVYRWSFKKGIIDRIPSPYQTSSDSDSSDSSDEIDSASSSSSSEEETDSSSSSEES